MADTPGLPGSQAIADQLAHNVADGAAHNQATIDGLQHSLAEGQANIMNSLASNQASLDAGWAQEAQRAEGLDAVFNSLNGPTPGIVPGVTPGFEGPAPHFGAPQPDGLHVDGPPMGDIFHPTGLDGETPGFVVHESQSLHDGDGDADDGAAGGGIFDALAGFDLDDDDGDLQDAIHTAQEHGGVVVVEEVIVIDPGGADTHDHSGGDFSL